VVQASVAKRGAYAVPTARGAQTFTIHLVRTGGQWRISGAPGQLLLSALDFAADYQSRNLYFFNPARSSLVADPVYVPLNAVHQSDPTELLSGLVNDLIFQPDDWLNPATGTAFPAGTRLVGRVTLTSGSASVNLSGAGISRAALSHATSDVQVMEELTAQLLWTLIGSGNEPAVTSVQLSVNGKPWMPPGSSNPAQQQGAPQYRGYAPAAGSESDFYYLDAKGSVWHRPGPGAKAVKVWKAGAKDPRLSAIAVSPDGKYLAGLSGGSVYIGPAGGTLQDRLPGSYTSLSWDFSDQLWVAVGTDVVEMLRGSGGGPALVTVATTTTGAPAPAVSALRVAPDGVRVAVVLAGTETELGFGAISAQQVGRTPSITITLSPFSVIVPNLAGVTWYGADSVIALSGSGAGSTATEYPVNGGAPTDIHWPAGMVNITASWGNPLIASYANGEMLYNQSVSGTWAPLNVTGQSVTYPG
jgi:hypothetical protein